MNIPIEAIIAAAQAGGAVIMRHFGEILDIEEKLKASDVRTQADTGSETAILGVLREHFPEASIYSEEYGLQDNHSAYKFVVDPLDGTNNFVLGIPNFSVSIALLKDDEVVAAVVHQPVINYTFQAQKGQGAFLNGKRLHVNGEADPKRSTVSYTCGYVNSAAYHEALIRNLSELGTKRVLENWSPAYEFCMLAAGKLEAVINNANDLYDYAAGKLLVTEAGGLITDYKNKAVPDTADVFLASNGTALHGELLKQL